MKLQEDADERVWLGFENAIEKLENKGADVVELPFPTSYEYVHPAHSIIFAAEAASVHEKEFRKDPSKYKPKMRGHIASGLLIPSSAYLRAKRIKGIFSGEVKSLLTDVDCLLTPSSVTPALKGLESTGDPAFNVPWSFSGFPTISVPCGFTEEGLPLGIQISGEPYSEGELLSMARWFEDVFGFPNRPRDP